MSLFGNMCGMNIEISKASFVYSCPKLSIMRDCGDEIAFFGRSNAGKSSLINSVMKKELAKTSKTPGRTRHAVVYDVRLKRNVEQKKISLVDLPGFGFALMSKEEALDVEKLVFSYLENRANLKAAFLLMDIRRIPNEVDLKIIEICTYKNINLFLVLTKYDKISKSHLQPAIQNICKLLNLSSNQVIVHSTFFPDSSENIREKIFDL
jgi:GTP-binding protein